MSTKTKKKFQQLLRVSAAHTNPPTPTCNAKAIHNATTVTIPPETKILLSLGPQFALPYTSLHDIPFYNIIADIENILTSIPEKNIREYKRCDAVNIIQNFIHSFDDNPRDSLSCFLQHACKTTKRFIKSHPDIIIVNSDKGKQTVLMYEKEYDSKMCEMLSDQNTYKPIKQNPTTGYQQQNNCLVKRLHNLGLIDKKTANQLSTQTAQSPRIYGLPKSHKPNLPLRPILPNINAPSYMLSKFIGRILQSSINSRYNVSDSFSFCRFINSVQLPEDHILVSFDVASLFTCIPRELVTHTIIERWTYIKLNTNINLDLFLEVTTYCLECSYFSYRGKHFRQVFGTAMGNPLSPTVADLVMKALLDSVIAKLDFPIPVLRKYVDDLCLALPKDKVNDVLSTFNEYNSNIQFTCEIENNKRLPFLDMVLIRQPDQSVETEWYAKPMASGRFLDYFSTHPLHMKNNVVTNFMRRVKDFSTNLSPKEVKTIIDRHLKINHYPTHLRNRYTNRINERSLPINQSHSQDSPKTYKPLIYVQNLCSRLTKLFRTDLPNTTLATRNERTVGAMFTNMKDKLAAENQHNVIYRISCGNCKAFYVGLTTTQLKKRLSNHRSNINKLEQLLNQEHTRDTNTHEIAHLKEKTALLQHSIDSNHRFNLEKTIILDHHRRPSALPILEVCHIMNTEHTVNKRTDVDCLSSTYAGILHTLKTKIGNRSEL
ncbi:uncharacterized protein LOC129729127 [Wyeomyia smithii]|uniref:uncharacterized protein LOC129729127 n=1 Tax=Wyeomyia smithii TaxID=174621 RepID=UPI002467D486|nr:uncharacterized protein LOC129729127 [Wyeomyia smithii]